MIALLDIVYSLNRPSFCVTIPWEVISLANTKSAMKRAITSEKRRIRNKQVRSRVKSVVRNVETAVVTDTDPEMKLRQAVKVIDQAVTKGVLHPNNGARKKSRLYRLYNRREEA